MTEISEPARQMAADLANAERRRVGKIGSWDASYFENDTLSIYVALARLCARTIERDALLARMQEDMAEIYGLCAPHRGSFTEIAAIAARYRVEADPLVEAIAEHMRSKWEWAPPELVAKRAAEMAELAKRGLELGAAK